MSTPKTGTRNIQGVSEDRGHRRVSTNQAKVVAAVAINPRKSRTATNRGVQSICGTPSVTNATLARTVPPEQ